MPRLLSRDRRPGRIEAEDPGIHRARADVRPWKIAGADQELPRDLAAGETEGFLEQLHPLRLLERMVRVQPRRKRPMPLAQGDKSPGVLDRRTDFQSIAHDPRVAQQSRPLTPA